MWFVFASILLGGTPSFFLLFTERQLAQQSKQMCIIQPCQTNIKVKPLSTGENNLPCSGKLVTISCFKRELLQTVHWFKKMPPKVITTAHCIRIVNKPAKTELLLCVKAFALSQAGGDRRNMVDFRRSSTLCGRRSIISDTVNIYATESNISLCFYFSWEFGNYVDKNLSLPHRTGVYLIYFFFF